MADILHGNAAAVLASKITPKSIDMIYADPPFFTQAEWTGPAGSFDDRWTWDADAERRTAMDTAKAVLMFAGGETPLAAYMLAMSEMIAACRAALRDTGTFWLHCDDTASAYLRIICDLHFGPRRLWGISVWQRSNANNAVGRKYGRIHDTIIVYVASGAALARLIPTLEIDASEVRWTEIDGVSAPMINIFFDVRLAAGSKERVGYPTQKPIALIKQFIEIGSLPGDTVLDPCCGSGTTLVAAQETGRRAVGIDQSADAVSTAARRIAQPAQMMLAI